MESKIPIMIFGAWIKPLIMFHSFNSVYKDINLHKHLHSSNIYYFQFYLTYTYLPAVTAGWSNFVFCPANLKNSENYNVLHKSKLLILVWA